ncbi:hypothetical protein NLJ89_g10705 [Agrocybe chaxingu]|uniref:Uncharacterized protein n=1 Tax=Agrocybe chaxingu TaxID=84603 RepID=A0A9W8MQN5_9AGAR|nr:hypothetical protein NLJ89_g10705 [Agrocybe chaxingu]
MSTSLVIPTDADFMFLHAQYFSEGFNIEEWQLSNENEFGPFFSECFDREPPLVAADSYDHATTSAPTGMGPQPNLSMNICFPGAGGVTAPTYFTSENAYPTGYFPSSNFTFHVAQPAYPSSHYCPEHPSTNSSNSPTYNGPNTSMEYNFGLMQAATYGAFPCSSSNCLDAASVHQRVALDSLQPTASGSNPRSGFGLFNRQGIDVDNATEVPQQPPKKRRRVQVKATTPPSTSASRSSSSASPSSPSGSSSSASTSASFHGPSSSSPGSPAQSSSNYVHLPDGRYRCRICTGKAAYADTEKDIVRHLDTAKTHNPQQILCKDTVYRCPCRNPRLLGKRKDSRKRHVRSYIVAERGAAIELKDQERLSKVNAYEARLKSEKLL